MYNPWGAKITCTTSVPWTNWLLHNLNLQRGGQEVSMAGLACT